METQTLLYYTKRLGELQDRLRQIQRLSRAFSGSNRRASSDSPTLSSVRIDDQTRDSFSPFQSPSTLSGAGGIRMQFPNRPMTAGVAAANQSGAPV